MITAIVISDFELGRVVITRGALATLKEHDVTCAVVRHASSDWGNVCQADWEANDLALAEGTRLLSVYEDQGGTKFWVITEADRSVTTVLLPSEY